MTRFVLGCAPLGGLYTAVSEEQAESTLAEAWRLGVRAFDTAPHYGAGLSERRVGAFLSTRPRDELVLSTKVGRLLVSPDPGEPISREFASEPALRRVFDYSAAGVRRSLEESLERLRLDRVDIALVHDPDEHLDEALSTAFPTLAALRDEGVVGAIGAGMNFCAPLERIVEEADVDCVLVAGRYNLLDQEAADGLLPRCAERGVAVLIAGVLGSDVLVDPQPSAHYLYRPAPAEIIERARRIRQVCEQQGVALPAAALHFPLRHPAVTAILVGARSAEEVDQDLAHLATPVPEALYDALAELGLIRPL
ncbi:MAG TPA: aldo/keto reductase [Acidimicrobiales bacterium]|nr:aldo/keto reductase [Acidimicrobiales bacterium]